MVSVDIDVIHIAACVGGSSVGIRGGNDQDRGCAQSVGELASLGEGEDAQEAVDPLGALLEDETSDGTPI